MSRSAYYLRIESTGSWFPLEFLALVLINSLGMDPRVAGKPAGN